MTATTVRPADPATRPRTPTRNGLVLALVVTCQLMIVLDATVVNVALPPNQSDLGFSPTGLSWVVNAYTLTVGGLLLLGAALGVTILVTVFAALTLALVLVAVRPASDADAGG